MELIHSKCGRKVSISMLRGGKCKKCNRRWFPFLHWFALDLRPIPASEVKEKKEKKIMERKVAAAEKNAERRKYGKWAESTPGATVLPNVLPNWPRWARLLTVAIILGIIAVICMWWFNWW